MNKIGNYTPHIQLSQIAGMLPRAIVSDDGLDYYNAGDYLGMIKFGSRVELFLSHCDYVRLNVKEGQKIKLGELIGEYVVR
jgi:phosphatidylserine decarboxylase